MALAVTVKAFGSGMAVPLKTGGRMRMGVVALRAVFGG